MFGEKKFGDANTLFGDFFAPAFAARSACVGEKQSVTFVRMPSDLKMRTALRPLPPRFPLLPMWCLAT